MMGIFWPYNTKKVNMSEPKALPCPPYYIYTPILGAKEKEHLHFLLFQ